MLASVRIVGWGIALIVLQDILAVTANTAGWRAAFPTPRPPIPFPTLLVARIAGDALNYLTPTATLGGEFARTRMLGPYAPTTSVVASVTVAKLTQALRRLAGWPTLHRLTHLRPAVDRLDREIASTFGESPGSLAVSSTVFCLGWTLGVVESYLVLYFLDLPASLEKAFAVEVLGVAFNNAVLFFVPLRASTQEAGKVLAFTVAGLDPVQGFAGGIVGRIRELF